jgi:hypothetical protein
MKNEGVKVDLWSLLEQSANPLDSPPSSSTKKPSEEEARKNKKKIKRFLLFADCLSLLFWLYVLTQLFLINLDSWLVHISPEPIATLLTYKYVLFFTISIVVGVFFWKWLTAALLLYVFSFPLLAICWRIPRLLYKSQGWLGVMGFVNWAGLAIKNLRYNLISKSLAIISAVIILFTNIKFLIILAIVCLFFLLTWGSGRTVRLALRSNWFVEIHEKIINKFVNSGFLKGLVTVNEDLKTGHLSKLDNTQVSSLTNNIQFGLIATKGLYFWAYQLQQYREKYINVLFNITTFVWLLLGGALTFWLVNIGLYKIDPSQFSASDTHISNLSMLVYSISGLFFSDGAGIIPSADLAQISRILAGLFGTVFLLTVVMNVVMILRQSKDDRTLNKTVGNLKKRAGELDDEFQGQFSISPDEALEKMVQMKRGMYSFIALLTSRIPKDFMRIEDDSKDGPIS